MARQVECAIWVIVCGECLRRERRTRPDCVFLETMVLVTASAIAFLLLGLVGAAGENYFREDQIAMINEVLSPDRASQFPFVCHGCRMISHSGDVIAAYPFV